MAKDTLKGKNSPGLFGVVLLNLAVFYGATQQDTVLVGDWGALLKNWRVAVPVSLGALLVGIVNAQIAPMWKAVLVFWRWPNPLPGSEAFSRHMPTDPRIDGARLASKHGELPTDPVEQNQLWYRIYLDVAKKPAVAQAHRAFLFARDYACLAAMMVVLLGIAGFIQIPSLGTSLVYFSLLLVQFLVVRQAAKNNGIRFVTTVLAIDAAKEPKGNVES